MPSGDSTSTVSRKRRVGKACDFCRQRKLGCDNAKPKCQNCQSHCRDCFYTERHQKERPSNFRIQQLEDENTQIRASLEKLKARFSDQDTSVVNAPLPNDSERVGSHSKSQDRLFQGESPQKRQKTATIEYDDWKAHLLAETSKQRGMEQINRTLGKLDFDGVDPELGMHLLSVFWNRQHSYGSVVYRPCFMRDMACSGPYFSPLLLNAMYFVASKNSPKTTCQLDSTDNCEEGIPFRKRIEEILYDPRTQVLCRSKVTTAQALLLISDALFSWCDEKSLSWHYLGIAITMIIDLGIHVNELSPLDMNQTNIEELEVHRRLFWAAFVFDKTQSIYQARPARLREIDNNVPLVFLDEYEDIEPFHTLAFEAQPKPMGVCTYSVSTFKYLCQLSIIANRICETFYATKSPEKDPEELLRMSFSLNIELKRWRQSLPAYLSMQSDATESSTVLPHVVSMLSMYHSLVILLNRPFLSESHLRSVAECTSADFFSACSAAASEIHSLLRLYRKKLCVKSSPYFLSYATYVSATIHARIAAQKSPGSQAHHCLRNCLEVLSEQQILCHGPRRSLGRLVGLVRRLRVDVGQEFTAATSRTAESEAPAAEYGGGSSTAVLDTSLSRVNAGGTSSVDGHPRMNFTATELDMDALIRSFEPAPRQTLAPLEPRQGPGNDMEISNSAAEFESAGPHRDIVEMFPVTGTFDEFIQDPFGGFMAEPLLGFDSLIPYPESIH